MSNSSGWWRRWTAILLPMTSLPLTALSGKVLEGKAIMTDDRDRGYRTAYEEARKAQSPVQAPLPQWDDLPPEMRDAIIHVYFAGRKDAQS
jgi:hypothetical protein